MRQSRLVIEAARAAAGKFVDGVVRRRHGRQGDADRLIDVIASAIGLEIAEAGTNRQALQS